MGFLKAVVRLPFILSGIVSMYLVYLIGKKWFNKNTGLLSALSMAFLQFPLIYSQLARLYSPGLLFSLATVWFWTLLIKDKKQMGKSFSNNLYFQIIYPRG
ncbi:MAG: glycosyltransferase family 39 protein [Bacteroidales bacterium]|nr:glycosyltransferase family 39 protein [Bacteroidales bacterium]